MNTNAKVYEFSKMLENGEVSRLAKRSFPQGIERMKYFWPSFTWYHPGAYSIPHEHPNIEAMYYFTFEGEGKGSGRLFLGWPYSKADLIDIDGPTLVTIPTGVSHGFANTGDTMMGMLCCYAQDQNDPTVYINDLLDVVEGGYFMSGGDFNDIANRIYAECPTLDDFIAWLKKTGKY